VQPVPGAVGPGGQQYQPQQAPPPQAVQPPYPVPTHSEPVQQFQPGLSGLEKEISIVRQAAMKCVAMSVETLLPPEQRDPKGMVEAAEAFVAYFIQGPLRFGVTPFNQPQRQAAPPTYAPPTPQAMGQQAAQQFQQQTDIFGAPMDAAGNPVSGDPGNEHGDPGPLAQYG